jgi:sortase (surface protein transpeptidase)
MMSRRLALTWGTCAVVAAAGITILAAAPRRIPPSLPPPAAAAPLSPAVAAAPPRANGQPPAPRVVPAWLAIPAIGVSAPVAPEGLDAAGALMLPPLSAGNLAGWYSGGPAPGQDGPAVIAGHVDSAAAGPLVFWRLRDLRPGDRIEVFPGPLVFTVTSIVQVPKGAFPTRAVYGPTPGPALRLVTCGGPFDTATGHYTDNVIAFAVLIAKTR